MDGRGQIDITEKITAVRKIKTEPASINWSRRLLNLRKPENR